MKNQAEKGRSLKERSRLRSQFWSSPLKEAAATEAKAKCFEAVLMVAKLGGFYRRPSSGFPGVASIWRGLTVFLSILRASVYFS